MDMIYWAIIGLGAFVAVWFLFVVPAERRHHERKLEMIRKRIEKRRTQADGDNGESSGSSNDDEENL